MKVSYTFVFVLIRIHLKDIQPESAKKKFYNCFSFLCRANITIWFCSRWDENESGKFPHESQEKLCLAFNTQFSNWIFTFSHSPDSFVWLFVIRPPLVLFPPRSRQEKVWRKERKVCKWSCELLVLMNGEKNLLRTVHERAKLLKAFSTHSPRISRRRKEKRLSKSHNHIFCFLLSLHNHYNDKIFRALA